MAHWEAVTVTLESRDCSAPPFPAPVLLANLQSSRCTVLLFEKTTELPPAAFPVPKKHPRRQAIQGYQAPHACSPCQVTPYKLSDLEMCRPGRRPRCL
jgi:hypothetical protein